MKSFRKSAALGLAVLTLMGCQPGQGSSASSPAAPVPVPPVGTPAPVNPATPPVATPGVSATATPGSTPVAAVTPPGKPLKDTLVPLPDKTGRFPVITRKTTLKMTTSAGDVMIEIYPEAAPNACKRFLELVESGFYDEVPFSRVVKSPAPFVAQFGINWRTPHNQWEKKNFKDDPSYFSLEKGTLCFAKGGIDMNSTQVFINLRTNNQLADPKANFTVFGKVVKGMNLVDAFPSVGEPDSGLDQYRLWTDGANYLETLTTKPATIEKIKVVTP